MSRMFFRSFAGAVAATLVLAAATASRAQLTLDITESGGPTIPIIDGGALDTDGVVNGFISANTALLNLTLVNFEFTSLAAVSNSLTGGPLSTALLAVSGDVQRTATAGTPSIVVTATDSPFNFPTGNPKTMTTGASDTFANTTAGDSRTFQSHFNAINSPLLAFVPPVGAGPFSTSNSGVTNPLGSQPTGYTLSNTTAITLGPNSVTGVAIQSDNFNGQSQVSADAGAVPEPGALALLSGLAVPGLALLRRRR